MGHRFLTLALATSVSAAMVVSSGGIVSAEVSPDQQVTMLTRHNTLRASVAAGETERLGQAVTIADLTWNDEAATVAQAWADNLLATDTFEHNADRGDLGENIYWESGYDPATGAVRAFQSWADEAGSYTWDTDTCAETCGHYAQIVWSATTSVGCGMATDGSTSIWVCDYAPPGNYTGERPYEPGDAVAPGASAPTESPMSTDTPVTEDTALPEETSVG